MQNFITQVLNLDVRLFYFLNRDLVNPVFDFLMPIITNGNVLTIPLVALAVYFLMKGDRRTRIAIICMVVAVLLSDAIAYRYIKPFVGRLRPCDVLPGVHILASAGRYSFPSNHAVSMMSLAVVSMYFYRRHGWIIFLAAIIVGYSRIYVGVHYPLDVFAGFILGALTSMFVLLVYRGIEFEIQRKREKKEGKAKKKRGNGKKT